MNLFLSFFFLFSFTITQSGGVCKKCEYIKLKTPWHYMYLFKNKLLFVLILLLCEYQMTMSFRKMHTFFF